MMDQTHKDDAKRRLGRVLVYIISLAREDEAADTQGNTQAPAASATGQTFESEKQASCSHPLNRGKI
jgi:hypothetical protein